MEQAWWKWVLHIKMMLVFILPMIAQVASFAGQCGGLQQRWLSAENRALKNFVYKNKTVHNHVICGRDCGLDKNCKSFNFYKDNKLCELSKATRADHPEDFFEDQGSVYFDEDEDTPVFSLPDNSSEVQLVHYRSCKKLLEAGHHISGVYMIYPDGFSDGLQVYCDMVTDGGGWIVFQRRQDGSVDFYLGWDEYKSGFGNIAGEFWLGNDNLVSLTSDDSHGPWQLRVDLEDGRDGSTASANYKEFKIEGEKYTLYVSGYTGTAGDSLRYHNGMNFTTKDNDNDLSTYNCAVDAEGAWWFESCYSSHLNSIYLSNWQSVGRKGIKWGSFRDYSVSLKKCSIKIRESD